MLIKEFMESFYNFKICLRVFFLKIFGSYVKRDVYIRVSLKLFLVCKLSDKYRYLLLFFFCLLKILFVKIRKRYEFIIVLNVKWIGSRNLVYVYFFRKIVIDF